MQIKFGHPRRGLEGQFNTFRLGQGPKDLSPGCEVELVDARSGKLLKRAAVLDIQRGPLDVMAPLHAHAAHNWKTYPEDQRSELLKASLAKRYPPGRVREDSPVTVIYLEVLNECVCEDSAVP